MIIMKLKNICRCKKEAERKLKTRNMKDMKMNVITTEKKMLCYMNEVK